MNNKCKIRYLDRLQVVLKVSERCNLNCSYCYYFNGNNKLANKVPPIIKKEVLTKTIDDLTTMLDNGTELGTLEVILHGGEPLLLKVSKLEDILSSFEKAFGERVKLKFGLQTNGTLISDEFIELSKKYGVGVGISIDGLKSQHDVHRIYPSGRGSFEEVVKGIQKMQSHQLEVGVISVITNPDTVPDTYRFLTNELGVKRVSFLLPDTNHNDYQVANGVLTYGEALSECFDEWANNTEILFKNAVDYLDNLQKVTFSPSDNKVKNIINSERTSRVIDFRLIVIHSDGKLHHYDRFLPDEAKRYLYDEPRNILTTSMDEYLIQPVFEDIWGLYKDLPKECQKCAYVKHCAGGDLEHRFDRHNGFDNPSVYCPDLTHFYQHINRRLIENGMEESHIESCMYSCTQTNAK